LQTHRKRTSVMPQSLMIPSFHKAFIVCKTCCKAFKNSAKCSVIGDQERIISDRNLSYREKRRQEEKNRKLKVPRSRTLFEIDASTERTCRKVCRDQTTMRLQRLTAERSPVNPVSQSISRVTRFLSTGRIVSLKRTRFLEDAATILRFLSISVGDRPDG